MSATCPCPKQNISDIFNHTSCQPKVASPLVNAKKITLIFHHHHHHVPEGLGVSTVPWSSRWSWSLHLFLGRPMLLRPFSLYCSACFGSLFVSILCTCCSHFYIDFYLVNICRFSCSWQFAFTKIDAEVYLCHVVWAGNPVDLPNKHSPLQSVWHDSAILWLWRTGEKLVLP